MIRRRTNQPIRVLIVEDSRTQRELLSEILSAAGFNVLGVAGNGQEAVSMTRRLQPDVIAMDINLPTVDGYAATRQIMQQCPTPIVMMSGQPGDEQERSIRALEAGALAVVRKPRSPRAPGSAEERDVLLKTLRLMADVKVVTRFPPRVSNPHAPPTLPQPVLQREAPPEIIAIAASTGGPAALQQVLATLSGDFLPPVLVVQHITPGFVIALAEWLNSVVPLPVLVAQHGEKLKAGHIYLAPDNQHLLVPQRGQAALQQPGPQDRYCPSADVLFYSLKVSYGPHALGVVLTGMGDDGAQGLLALRACGALTIAQDQASSVVYGMPKAAAALDAARLIRPLAQIGEIIRAACSHPWQPFREAP